MSQPLSQRVRVTASPRIEFCDSWDQETAVRFIVLFSCAPQRDHPLYPLRVTPALIDEGHYSLAAPRHNREEYLGHFSAGRQASTPNFRTRGNRRECW